MIGFLKFIVAELLNPAKFNNVGDFPLKSVEKGVGDFKSVKTGSLGEKQLFFQGQLVLGKTCL